MVLTALTNTNIQHVECLCFKQLQKYGDLLLLGDYGSYDFSGL